MKSICTKKTIQIAILMAFAAFTFVSFTASAADTSGLKILEARFDSRNVVKVEAGDFHFKPGQQAPIHTHAAPAVGYVAKGTIIYQVEGEREQILRQGDAFYEPVGPRILRFDNASATEEAVFIDFNFEQADEPFIVFEKELTEIIDRRGILSVAVSEKALDRVDVYANALAPNKRLTLDTSNTTLGLVVEGIIVLEIDGKPEQRLVAGESFAIDKEAVSAVFANASAEVPANVITFRLL